MYRHALSIGILTLVFLVSMNITLIISCLYYLQNELQLSVNTTDWALSAYGVLCFACLIDGGRLSEYYGCDRTFKVCTLIFIGATTLSAMSNTLPQFIAMCAIQGLCAAMLISSGMVWLLQSSPAVLRHQQLARIHRLQNLGLCCGPMYGGLVTYTFSWHMLFWSQLPIMAVALLMTLWHHMPRRHIDRYPVPWSSGAIIITVILLIYTLNHEHLGWALAVLLMAGALAYRTLNIKTYSRPLMIACLTSIATYALAWVICFILPLYLHYNQLLSIMTTAAIMALLIITTTLSSYSSTYLLNISRGDRVLHALCFLSLISMLLFTSLTNTSSLLMIIITVSFFGITWGLSSSYLPRFACIGAQDQAGLAIGILQTVSGISAVLILVMSCIVFKQLEWQWLCAHIPSLTLPSGSEQMILTTDHCTFFPEQTAHLHHIAGLPLTSLIDDVAQAFDYAMNWVFTAMAGIVLTAWVGVMLLLRKVQFK